MLPSCAALLPPNRCSVLAASGSLRCMGLPEVGGGGGGESEEAHGSRCAVEGEEKGAESEES